MCPTARLPDRTASNGKAVLSWSTDDCQASSDQERFLGHAELCSLAVCPSKGGKEVAIHGFFHTAIKGRRHLLEGAKIQVSVCSDRYVQLKVTGLKRYPQAEGAEGAEEAGGGRRRQLLSL